MEPGPPGQQGPGWSPLPAYVRLASPVSSCLGFRSVQCDNRAGQQDTNVKKTHPVSWQIPVEGVESGRDRQRETAKQCSWQQVPGWKQPLKEGCSPGSASVNIVTPNRASLVPHTVKNLPAMHETRVRSLGQEDPLEEGMETHSSILAWRIPRTEEPGRHGPWGHKESDTTNTLFQ